MVENVVLVGGIQYSNRYRRRTKMHERLEAEEAFHSIVMQKRWNMQLWQLRM